MPTAPLRFGLVGYGAWGAYHAQAISETAGAELVAIAAKSNATRQAARDKFPHVAVCADYQDLIGRNDIDVVDAVLPSYLHHAVGAAALSAGKHLLLEKPMALTAAECADLVRLADENERVLTVGHELRVSTLWGRVKALIDEGRIGTPQYVLVELSRRPYRRGAEDWRFDIGRVGDWILEEPIHFFDLARWYLQDTGRPDIVFAAANARDPAHPELTDNFAATVKFAGGAIAVIAQTLSAFEHHQTVKVSGTKGALWASWSGAMDRTLQPTFSLRAFDGVEVVDVPIASHSGEVFELREQIGRFVRTVRDGAPPTASGEDGLWAVAMCQAARRSVESGSPVSMSVVLEPARSAGSG
jgi:myo-inositol 2-dehydrogenase / D-chiro-inositol 1-dehydrogenase